MILGSEVKVERDTSVPPKTTPQNAAAPAKSLMALVTAYHCVAAGLHLRPSRNLTPYESSVIVLALEPGIAEKADKRMKAGKADPTQKSAEGETRDELATLAGVFAFDGRDALIALAVVIELDRDGGRKVCNNSLYGRFGRSLFAWMSRDGGEHVFAPYPHSNTSVFKLC
jgi:hypothetical protein